MDRIINVKVNGHHLSKDNRVGGVRGEGNVTTLRIEFDEGWDGYTKTVTFYNALGENPVKRILTVDLLEDITQSTRIYLCTIPGEALTETGWFEFVIDGYAYGTRQRSLSDQLEVKYAPIADNADEPVDPTPTQAEQIQQQIDTILDDIAEQATIAYESAAAARLSETNASHSAAEARTHAGDAAESADAAQTFGKAAETAATNASKSATAAASSASQAKASAAAAAASEEQAAISRISAQAYQYEAGVSEKSAKASANEAAAKAEASASSAEAAARSQTTAVSAADAAATHERNAENYSMQAQTYSGSAWENAMVAESARKAAEKARDEAEQAVGGDFATKAYVDEAVANAGGDIDAGTF